MRRVRDFNPQRNTFLKNGKPLELFFERLIMSKCYIMSVSAMSRETLEPDNNLWRVIRDYVKQGLDNRKYLYLRKIAVGEKAYKKGARVCEYFYKFGYRRSSFCNPGKEKEVFEEFRAWLLSWFRCTADIKIQCAGFHFKDSCA